MYYSEEECYEDIYLSLSLGLLSYEDIMHLLRYYEDLEYYECCQGVKSAYNDYKNGVKKENINR